MGWHAKPINGWEHTDVEAQENAVEIYNFLNAQGYHLLAICAVLGNIYKESNYNPWQWQGNNIQPSVGYSSSVGYGLVQWTPPGEYIASSVAQGYAGYAPHFSDVVGSASDGAAQIRFVDYQIYGTTRNWFWNSSREQYYRQSFLDDTGIDIANVLPISKADFKVAAAPLTMSDLCIAFSLEYLRPHYLYAGRDYFKAVDEGTWWYYWFLDNPPGPEPPEPHEYNELLMWYARKKRKGGWLPL